MILKLFILITMAMSIMINVSQMNTVNAQEITNLPTFELTQLPELTPTPVPSPAPSLVPTLDPSPVPSQILVLPPNIALPTNVTDSINDAIVAFSDLQILITTLSSAGGIMILFIVVYLYIKFNGKKYIYLPSMKSTPNIEQTEQSKESSSKNITNIDIL